MHPFAYYVEDIIGETTQDFALFLTHVAKIDDPAEISLTRLQAVDPGDYQPDCPQRDNHGAILYQGGGW
jgi:hypothetical protein